MSKQRVIVKKPTKEKNAITKKKYSIQKKRKKRTKNRGDK